MEEIIDFLYKIGKLKQLKRTGWILKGVPDPESVADHTFRTTVMALILSEKVGLDRDKCMKMALIHDFGESIAGDITPYDNISKEEKYEMEKSAMKELFKDIREQEIFQLWMEYEERKTPEAKFVYDLDNIEMLLQAYEYEQAYKGKDINLDEFWSHVQKRIQNEQIKKIYEILINKRKSGASNGYF